MAWIGLSGTASVLRWSCVVDVYMMGKVMWWYFDRLLSSFLLLPPHCHKTLKILGYPLVTSHLCLPSEKSISGRSPKAFGGKDWRSFDFLNIIGFHMKERCMERSQVPLARAAVCEQEEMFLIPVRVYIYIHMTERERWWPVVWFMWAQKFTGF